MARRYALEVFWSGADAQVPWVTFSWCADTLSLDGALEGVSSCSRPPGTVC
jgi:hypothetical protein